MDDQGCTVLTFAGAKGNLETVEYLVETLRCPLDPMENENYLQKKTAFHFAKKENKDVLRYLVSKGAKTNVIDQNDCSPLMVATLDANEESLKILLDLKCDVSQTNNFGRNCLSFASEHNKLPIVKELIAAGAEIDAVDKNGNTALHFAAENGNGTLDVVQFLLEKQADPNLKDNDGWNSLMFATSKGDVKIVKYLVSNKAETKIINKEGWSPLMIAVSIKNVELARYFVDLNCDPNIISTEGQNQSALTIAIENDQKEIIEFLVPKVDLKLTAFKAAENGDLKVLELLNLKGVNLNIVDQQQRSPLMLACVHEANLDVVTFLVLLGCDPNAINDQSQNCLHIASLNGNIKIVRHLISLKCDPNAISKDGHNALTISIHKQNHQTSEYLYSLLLDGTENMNEKDPSKRKIDIKNTLFLAMLKEELAVFKFLHSKEIDFNHSDETGWTLLLHACAKGKLAVVTRLVSLKCDPNITNNEFQTCLHIAALNGHLGIVRYLISIGCNPNALDQKKRLPLDLARETGQTLVFDYLKNISPQFYNEMRSLALQREYDNTSIILKLEDLIESITKENAIKSNIQRTRHEEDLSDLNNLQSVEKADIRKEHIIELKAQADRYEKQIKDFEGQLQNNDIEHSMELENQRTAHENQLQELYKQMNDKMLKYDKEIASMKLAHSKDVSKINRIHNQQITSQTLAHEKAKAALEQLHKQEQKKSRDEFAAAIADEQRKCEVKIENAKATYNMAIKVQQKTYDSASEKTLADHLAKLKEETVKVQRLELQISNEKTMKSFQFQKQIEDLQQQLKTEAESSKTSNVREVDCENELVCESNTALGGIR